MLKMHNRYLQNDRGIDIIEGNLERVKKKAPPKRCYIRSCKVLAVLHRDCLLYTAQQPSNQLQLPSNRRGAREF